MEARFLTEPIQIALGYLKISPSEAGDRKIARFAQHFTATPAPVILSHLIKKFSAKNLWHPQFYSLSDQELSILTTPPLRTLLLPFKLPGWATDPLIYEDDTHYLFRLDDIIKMLRADIRAEETLRSFYLFLLENDAFSGVMLVAKVFYEQVLPSED
jgi:hypothetical protein